MKVSDVLWLAADEIEYRGKATSAYVDDEGRVCAAQAIGRRTSGVRGDAYEAFRTFLLAHGFSAFPTIMEFSDTHTDHEVISALRTCAEEQMKKEK